MQISLFSSSFFLPFSSSVVVPFQMSSSVDAVAESPERSGVAAGRDPPGPPLGGRIVLHGLLLKSGGKRIKSY